ncbi:MAG: autorepressor SdpR family transcription factor [Oscillospiraceae bacterium]
MSDVWSALSDPTRRKILKLLKSGDMNAGDIAAKFDMTKPSVSHHLNILKQAELVDSEKKGQNLIYTLRTSVLEDALTLLAELSNKESSNES